MRCFKMRLKNVFAGVMAAAMMASALAVPAFAAAPAEEENCIGGTYVMMNVPYDEFYDAVGVNNSADVDAVASATKSKTRAGNLAAGSYHVNADGSDITGVTAPVRIYTPSALGKYTEVTDATSYDITVTLRGKETTTTYAGVDALFENATYSYYKLSETPAFYVSAWYNFFTGELQFGKVHANPVTVEGVTAEVELYGHHTDYEIVLNGFEALDYDNNRIYAVVVKTSDGTEYGLRHVYEIWRGTELGWDGDDAYYGSTSGKTITEIVYYTAEGVYELPVNIELPVFSAEAKAAAEAEAAAQRAAKNQAH